MLTIHKFPIDICDNQVVEMPVGAQVLSAELQRGSPCLWALIDTDKELTPRRITIRGTGHCCTPSDGRFINTIMMARESLVWHVFDGGEL